MKETPSAHWAQQSPIDINDSLHAAGLQPLRFHYPRQVHGAWQDPTKDPGYSFLLDPDSGAHLDFSGQRCPLLKIHLHTPSEHKLDGESYPMEIHLVHKIPRPTWGSTAVVVGVFVKTGVGHPSLLEHLRAGDKHASGGPDVALDPNMCISNPRKFFRYEGSLTTPDYDETVSWIVLQTPLMTVAADIEELAKYAGHHAREPQPLQRRFVLRNFEAHPHGACPND